ncbi:MAG TPA: HAD family hydrolase [Bacillota bacterium]|nr:HAD family hydrolase [Bacillota bacterium]
MKGILFDLDGTLLDIDGEAFLERYLDALAPYLRPDMDPDAFRGKVMAAALPLITSDHLQGTVGDTFRAALADRLELPAAEVADGQRRLDSALGDVVAIPHAPRTTARLCVDAALDAGMRCAVATTPIYRPAVIHRRLTWAGLADYPWALVTTSENMHSCKPSPGYFREAAAKLGLQPADCIMVGDDPYQDGPSDEAGMRFHLVQGEAGWAELLVELAAQRVPMWS